MPTAKDVIHQAEEKMKKAIAATQREFASIRTGRAAPALLDRIHVDYYGAETPDWYVQITKAYTNLRTGLMPGSYYRDEDNPAVYKNENGTLVYRSSLPHQQPVIFLPAGTLAGLLATQ